MGKIQEREKFVRFKGLRCFKRAHDMLSYGYPAPVVARFIRGQGEYKDVTERSLIEQLKRYRRDILPSDTIASRQPHIVVEARKKYTNRLEELERLELQYEALLWRFDMLHARERDTCIVDPAADRVHKSILATLGQMHRVKMDLGISGQRQSGTVTMSAERLEQIRAKYGDATAEVMRDPVSRARVIAILKKAQDVARLESAGATKENLLKKENAREGSRENN
jgi:hypothetical protein